MHSTYTHRNSLMNIIESSALVIINYIGSKNLKITQISDKNYLSKKPFINLTIPISSSTYTCQQEKKKPHRRIFYFYSESSNISTKNSNKSIFLRIKFYNAQDHTNIKLSCYSFTF